MKGKIIKVDGNKVTIKPNENFMNIQITRDDDYINVKAGMEVDISIENRMFCVEIDGYIYGGILID